MARELGLDEERVDRVRLAGVLHDIGKIGISDRVLTKPGPLDQTEWQEMYTHPEIGARLLSRPEFADLREWILAHHERPDGLGYPHGIGEDRIPIEARILAVADAYEAMTADRCYRPAIGEAAAAPSSRPAPARSSTRPSWPPSCAPSTRPARSACAAWPSASEVGATPVRRRH